MADKAMTVFAQRPPASRQSALRRTLAGPPALLLLPVCFLCVFFVYPLWILLLRSLNADGMPTFNISTFTLANYQETFSDPSFWVMVRTTGELAVYATVATVAVAYPVAYFMSRAPRRVARVLLMAVMLPYLSSILIRLYAFTQILTPLGLQGTTAGAVVGMVAYLLPFMIIMLHSAMVAIDPNLGPAARTLGARPWHVFSRVLFPQSRAALVSATLFVFVVSLGFYLTPAVLGSPTKPVVSTYIYQRVEQYEWGSASAIGMALLIVTLLLFAFSSRAMSLTAEIAAGGSGKGVSSSGAFRWTRGTIVLGAWSGLVALFLLMPLLVVVWASFTSQSYLEFPPSGYSLKWYESVFSDDSWGAAAWLSVKAGVLTAFISTALGLAAAFGLARGRIRAKPAFRIFFYLPLVMPVVLVGAALFGLELRLRLTGTLMGLVVGHVVLTLPVTIVILTTALSSVPRNIELAARTLGANPLRAFWRTTVPALAASLGSAALITFLTSLDEAVVSQFIVTNQPTLPVKYLTFLHQQVQPDMAAVGTLLMVGSLLAYIIIARGSRLLLRAWRSHLLHREERP